jgi:hypothetical protein
MDGRRGAENIMRSRLPTSRSTGIGAAGACFALLIGIGCSSNNEPPADSGGTGGTGGTGMQGVGGANAGKGGTGGTGTTTGGSSGAGGTGASGGTGGTNSVGGTGAGGQAGKPGSGGGAGTGATMGGRPGSAGSGGASGSGTGGASGTGVGGTNAMGGRPGTGGSGAGGAPMGGRSMGGSSGGGAPAAGAGGSGGSGGNFDPCPATDPCKILPLGDSITFGIQYEGAYRVELFHKALADGKKITYVGSQTNGPSMVDNMAFPKSHEGHSGYTIDQMKPFAMTTDVTYKPNIITLHIGTNDTYGSSPSGAPMRLQALVDLITSTYPDTLLVVAKIVPYPSQAANVKLINDSIPDTVNSRAMQGKHVIMVDCNTGFMTSSMLSSDSIHPNQTGYNFMGDQFYAGISKYLH